MEHRCLSPWKGAVVGGFIAFACGALSGTATLPYGLATRMIAAFCWTWILGKIPGLTLKDAALYGLFFGICVGVLGEPQPSPVHLADAALAWTLASLALSRCYARTCALPS